jgi:hypothetical protein
MNRTEPVMRAKKEPLKVGDWVKLRGRLPIGTITEIDKRKWTRVDWDPTKAPAGPRLVHLDELETVHN